MEKRQLILNDYKTADAGLWTLASCKITKAAQAQTFVSVPGRYTPLDLSTALTDGQPYYGSASLEAVLESSEGTREERQERIGHMVNLLDGYTVRIVHPDHPSSYMVGRVQITPKYNDLVHCSVTVRAVCEPWFYNMAETVVTATVPTDEAARKNLLPYPYKIPRNTIDDLTITVNPDRSISLKGQVHENVSVSINSGITFPAGTYTVSGMYPEGWNGAKDGYYLFCGISSGNGDTFTFTEEKTGGLGLVLIAGVDYDLTMRPQIEAGPVATEYEYYYEPNKAVAQLNNGGRLCVVPLLTVEGEVSLTYGASTWQLSSGSYQLPDIYLTPGQHLVTCAGDGTVTFSYREAVLAV